MKRAFSVIPVVAVCALLAGSLLWLAMPRLGAAYIAMPFDRQIAGSPRIRALDREAATGLAKNFERLIAMTPAQPYSLAAITMYTQLLRIADVDKRVAAAARMHDAAIRELSWRPMQSRVWWALSYADYTRDRWMSASSRAAILRSVELQEYALSLVPVRLQLILRHWRQIPSAQRGALRSQFVQVWRLNPRRLTALARNPNYTDIIRWSLAIEPAMLRSLEAGLGKMRLQPVKPQ